MNMYGNYPRPLLVGLHWASKSLFSLVPIYVCTDPVVLQLSEIKYRLVIYMYNYNPWIDPGGDREGNNSSRHLRILSRVQNVDILTGTGFVHFMSIGY